MLHYLIQNMDLRNVDKQIIFAEIKMKSIFAVVLPGD